MTDLKNRIVSVSNKMKIESFLQEIKGKERHSGELFLRGWNSSRSLGTFQVLRDQSREAAGLLTAWKTEFHPFCTYIAVLLSPAIKMEEEMEAYLLDQVNRLSDKGSPLQTLVDQSEEGLINFLMRNGFMEVRKTYLAELCLDKTIINILAALSSEIEPAGAPYKIIEMTNVFSDTRALKEELISLVKHYYESTHAVNPPGAFSLDEWEEFCFQEDVVGEGSYLVIEEGRVAAFAFLHKSEQEGVLELGWRGAEDNKTLYTLLLSALQLRFAASNGYNRVEAEVDTTDPCAMAMFEYFPFSGNTLLITYQKEWSE